MNKLAKRRVGIGGRLRSGLVRWALRLATPEDLPVVSVSYSKVPQGGERCLGFDAHTAIHYRGLVEGTIDGHPHSSRNGTFTVVQPYRLDLAY